jgi:hypothetical protein
MDVVLSRDGVVVNVVVVDSLAEAQAAFPDYVCTVREPDAVAPPVARRVSRLALRRRLTLAERIAFDHAPTNPSLPEDVRAMLATMAKDLELAEDVDLDDADIVAGLALLESVGILAEGRAAEIRA